MQKLKQKLLLILLGLTIVNPTLVFAQTAATKPTSYQGVQGSIENYLCTPSTAADDRILEKCINKLYRFGISFGAIALVFFLVYAGYMYITGGETGKSNAKGILGNALIGMTILLSSYLLLGFINPNLLLFKTIQPPIFTAAEIPDCDKLGYTAGCVIEEFLSESNVPSSSGCKTKFANKDEAQANLVTFDVKAWSLSGTSTVPKDFSVTVQKCLAEKTKAVFEKIYASAEKQPIKDIGGFSWRMNVEGTAISLHSYGLTLDINWEENYYVSPKLKVGKYWKPCPSGGCDVYSLPSKGSVVKEFKAAGFGWGGEWSSKKDYMHFSCHPTENGKCF